MNKFTKTLLIVWLCILFFPMLFGAGLAAPMIVVLAVSLFVPNAASFIVGAAIVITVIILSISHSIEHRNDPPDWVYDVVEKKTKDTSEKAIKKRQREIYKDEALRRYIIEARYEDDKREYNSREGYVKRCDIPDSLYVSKKSFFHNDEDD